MPIENLKTKIEKSANEWAKVHTDALRVINQLPSSLIDKVDFSASVSGADLIIKLPYSIPALAKARKELGKGWKREMIWGQQSPGFTYKCFSFVNPNFPGVKIRLDLEMGRAGSTCKLNLVGEKTVPVYEVVCN